MKIRNLSEYDLNFLSKDILMALIGPAELLVVGAAILALIIGPKKLPELARSLGESKKEFKKSMQEADEVVEEAEEVVEDAKTE